MKSSQLHKRNILNIKMGTIAKGDATYGAWIEDVAGIYGQGDTVEDAKQSLHESLLLYKKYSTTLPPALQGEIELEYKLDVPSFSGFGKPSPRVARKKDKAIHSLAHELQQVRFA